MLKFYDLSNHQGGLDITTLTDSDAFIFKATEGTFFVDKWCDSFVQQAKKLNKPYGVYHFLDGSDVVDQARYFYSNILGYIGEAVLVLDYEAYGRQGASKAKLFMDTLAELSGVKPWIYMNEYDANNDNWSNIKEDYGLWCAKYSSNSPEVPNLFMVAWQYTSTPLDQNYFYGTTENWKAYTITNKPLEETGKAEPKHDYYHSGYRFKAKVDLLLRYADDWEKLTGLFITKDKEFNVEHIIINESGSSHAILKNGYAVTLLCDYVELIE